MVGPRQRQAHGHEHGHDKTPPFRVFRVFRGSKSSWPWTTQHALPGPPPAAVPELCQMFRCDPIAARMPWVARVGPLRRSDLGKDFLANLAWRRYGIHTVMEFEYDPAKSTANEDKHGLNFEQAKALWLDDDRLVIPARSEGEPRWVMLAQRSGKVWAAFYTVLESRVRLISVRRARPNEKEIYEGR